MTLRNVAMLSAVTLAFSLASSPCFSFDVKRIEIEGIHLYDSDKKVIATLKKRFGSSVKLDVHMERRFLTEGKRIDSISLKYNNYFLGVRFSERAPPRKGNVVTNVHYLPLPTESVPGSNRDIFRNAILAKYGPPDLASKRLKANPHHARLTWCGDTRKQGWRSGFAPAADEPCKGWPQMDFDSDGITSPAGDLVLADAFMSDETYRYSQRKQ